MEQQEIFLQSLPCVSRHELPVAHGDGAENSSMQTFLAGKKKWTHGRHQERGSDGALPGKTTLCYGSRSKHRCLELRVAGGSGAEPSRGLQERVCLWPGLLGHWLQCQAAKPSLEIHSGDVTAALCGTGQLSWPLSCLGAGPRLDLILSCSLRACCLQLCLPVHCTENGFEFWLELLVRTGNLWHGKKS